MNRWILMLLLAALCDGGAALAQTQTVRIATGNAGGIYYPLGGALASVLSHHVPGVEAIAEATAGSIANLERVARSPHDIGFTMADSAWDAYEGLELFSGKRLAVRTLAVFYPNRMHVVTLASTGIGKFADLKGKRVSTGSPASGTEIMAGRLLEAEGLDAKRDLKRVSLSLAESVAALKQQRIDAFFWVGGVPTPLISELASTPGMQMRLIDHGEAAERMRGRYGPIYLSNKILANAYPGQKAESTNVDVWNLLVVPAGADEKLVYEITKALFENKDELVRAHKDASFLALANQTANASPIPFHPGALRYFREKGLRF